MKINLHGLKKGLDITSYTKRIRKWYLFIVQGWKIFIPERGTLCFKGKTKGMCLFYINVNYKPYTM